MATRIAVLDRLKRNQKSLGAGIYAALLSLVVPVLSGTVGLLVHLP
jgi:hypothetical protein